MEVEHQEAKFIVIYESGLPVTEEKERNSREVAWLEKGTEVEVVGREEKIEFRSRAPIASPKGWITTGMANGTGIQFVETPEAAEARKRWTGVAHHGPTESKDYLPVTETHDRQKTPEAAKARTRWIGVVHHGPTESKDYLLVTETADRKSKELHRLPKGRIVEVIEETLDDKEQRGRIESPEGWISLKTDDGDQLVKAWHEPEAPSTQPATWTCAVPGCMRATCSATPGYCSITHRDTFEAETTRYKVIRKEGLPVTATSVRGSAEIRKLAEDEIVAVCEDEMEDIDGRLRAPIRPNGWITLRMVDGGHVFVVKVADESRDEADVVEVDSTRLARSKAARSTRSKAVGMAVLDAERRAVADEFRDDSDGAEVDSLRLDRGKDVGGMEDDEEAIYYSKFSKLYCFAGNGWKDRGNGDAKLLKHRKTGQVRFMSQHEKTMKVLSNHLVVDDPPYCNLRPHAHGGVCWAWTAQDFADDQMKVERLALKFNTSEQAEEFKKAFDEAKQLNKKVDPMVEFSGMKLSELKQKARAEGIGRATVDDADRASDPKGAVVQMILANRKGQLDQSCKLSAQHAADRNRSEELSRTDSEKKRLEAESEKQRTKEKTRIHILPDDTIQWMWGDVHSLARFDPWRWSSEHKPMETIADLKSYSYSPERPVDVRISRAGKVWKSASFKTIADATFALRVQAIHINIWMKHDGLPSEEGKDHPSITTERFVSLEEMKSECIKFSDCVGFSYRPAQRDLKQMWFPKLSDTGFDPDKATKFFPHPLGETWEWHYIAPVLVKATRYVVWISLDPRLLGYPVPYSADVSELLESKWSAGEEHIVDISRSIPGASVDLSQTRLKQKTRKGDRTVCRLELPEKVGSIILYVIRDGKENWILTEALFGEPRQLEVTSGMAIETSRGASTGE